MYEVYAFQHNLDIRTQSASGGAFTAIVDAWKTKWLSEGLDDSKLVVYGAAFDESFNIVHKRATGDGWHEFRGSKYGVSDIRNVSPSILKDLEAGSKVLFSGTPCQVAAIKTQMERKGFGAPEIFYLDILCHGTPKKRVWDDYKMYIEKLYGGKLTAFSFRSKKTASHEPVMSAEFSNGKRIVDSMELRTYLDLYFTYYSLRKCCYSCKFSKMERVSDLTIGDFWGADKIFKNVNIYKGISQILVNTDFGGEIWGTITVNNKYDYCVKNEGTEFLRYQHNLSAPTECPQGVEAFWEFYNLHSYEEVVKKYLGSGAKHKLVFTVKRVMAYMGIKEKIKRLIKR